MKSIMYHYIREFDNKLPFANFLSIANFKKQLRLFSQKGICEKKTDIMQYSRKYLLTFDDGLKDHLEIAELLKKKNYIGIFFIPSFPYLKKDLLDVHKAHLILGKVGGKTCFLETQNYLKKNRIFNFINKNEKNKFLDIYKTHKDDQYKKEFKRIINYYGNLNFRKRILKFLLKKFDIEINYKKFYLSEKEIKYMKEIGMIIGAHSHSHILLSRLNYFEQIKEIKTSKKFLENLLDESCNYFCYPYGKKGSYNKSTLKILKDLNFKKAFVVKHNSISKKTFLQYPYELPRFDCNQF